MENDLISRTALLDTLQNHFGQDLAYLGEDLQYCQESVQIAPAVEAEPKWISTEERLPKNFETVIIWRNDCRNACIGWLIDDRWSVPKGVKVTHWMPLPEPPKEDGGAGND